MLRFERLVSILQLRYKLLKLVLDAFRQLVQLGPLQNLEQDHRHLLLTRKKQHSLNQLLILDKNFVSEEQYRR